MTAISEEGLGAYPFLLRAAAEGRSANAALSALAESGLGVRRQVGLRLYAEARRTIAEAGETPLSALSENPGLGPLTPSPTRNATGVLQTVRVVSREKVTGNIRTHFYNVKTDEGITWQEAVNRAQDAYSANSEDYPTSLVAAIPSSAIRLTPTLYGAA
jgi:hypothetical protein